MKKSDQAACAKAGGGLSPRVGIAVFPKAFGGPWVRPASGCAAEALISPD